MSDIPDATILHLCQQLPLQHHAGAKEALESSWNHGGLEAETRNGAYRYVARWTPTWQGPATGWLAHVAVVVAEARTVMVTNNNREEVALDPQTPQ